MPSRGWKIVAGCLGGLSGAAVGYYATTFIYVGLRYVAHPGFEPLTAGEIPYVAAAGGLFLAALGAFVGVMVARVATAT
jgi:hypothetical protein